MHWNKSDRADFPWLTHKGGAPRGSSVSWNTVGALMCWAYTHQSPLVWSKFSLYSCNITVLFFLGFLSGFISTILSQIFSFFYCFVARVLLFCLLVEAHTCIYWDFQCCSPCTWVKKEKKYVMFSNKRGDRIYLPQFSHQCTTSVDFSRLCRFWGIY